MTEYGTIEFKEYYIDDDVKIEGVHFGSALVRMTFDLWVAMGYGKDALKIGNSFKLHNFNMKIIDTAPEKNWIICVNKDIPFWRIAVLFYKIWKLKK